MAKRKRFKWGEHLEMVHLMFRILDDERSKKEPETTEDMHELCRKCAVQLSAITGKDFTTNQIKGQCFITGDFKLPGKDKLRNLAIAIQTGYMTPERFETDIHDFRARKIERETAKETKKETKKVELSKKVVGIETVR